MAFSRRARLGIGTSRSVPFRELIGFFGWRNFPLPWPLIIALTVAVGTSICSFEPSALNLGWRVRIFFLPLAGAGLIAAALFIYLTWNEIGIRQIVGFHGALLSGRFFHWP